MSYSEKSKIRSYIKLEVQRQVKRELRKLDREGKSKGIFQKLLERIKS